MPSFAKICYDIVFVIVVAIIFPIFGGQFLKKLLLGDKEIYKLKKNYNNDELGTGEMFDVLSKRYDMVNTVLALGMDKGWRQQMVNVIHDNVKDIKEPILLDIATGTGEVAIQLANTIPLSKVIGIDPSQQMLHIGRNKIIERKLSHRIDLEFGNAQKLLDKYPINYFDGATISFGIRNVKNRTEALCQIYNVLKPNRLLSILEFSEPDNNAGTMGIIAKYFIRYIVPVIGNVVSGSPAEYSYLQKSIKEFPKPNDFINTIRNLQCDTTDTTTTDSSDNTETTCKADDNNGNSCKKTLSYQFNEVRHLNFGSVQLYIMTTQK